VTGEGKIPHFDSPSNPKVKRLVGLRDRKDRNEEKVILVEGLREVERAFQCGFECAELYICKDLVSEQGEELFRDHKSPRRGTLSIAAFVRVAMREGSDGVIGVFLQKMATLEHIASKPNPLLLAVEGVEKPGNLGALLRTADGAGCDGVLLLDGTVDVFNPNVIRASTGAVFSIPVISVDRAELLTWCKERDIKIIAGAPEAKMLYTKAPFSEACVIALGAEDVGLSHELESSADYTVYIPMRGIADSLNVSVTGAIMMYEARRQRER